MELFLLVLIFVGLAGTISLFLPKETSPPDFPLRQIGSSVESEDSAYMPLSTELSEPRIKGSDEKYCQECGSLILAKAEICPKCGVRQVVTSPSGRTRLAAALFALLLGWVGAHKFYLGKVGQGVMYVLFSWTFIPFVVSFIEGIVYLTMTDGDFVATYG
jgi:TM2 domain-containing membrane protein YozV